MILADQPEIEFNPLPADDQFARIFETSCRRPPTDKELATIGHYTVNFCPTGPEGSKETALRMMQAAGATIKAGDDPDQIIELLRYACAGEKPLGDGHIIADENGARYVAHLMPREARYGSSVMHNPFGSLRMKRVKDIAEEN